MRKRKETNRESKIRQRKAADLKEKRRLAEEEIIFKLLPIYNKAARVE